MNNLTLKNILPSDIYSTVIDKINYNNDQILQFGGGRVGETGRQGDPGLPGATGGIGADGADGARGSEIFSSIATLVDGAACSITDARANDWAIDSTGNYCLIVPDLVHGGLKYSLQFNVVSSSAADFVNNETNYYGNVITGVVDRWRLKDGGISGKDRNLVFAKRITDGATHDVSDFYRLVVGADQYPTAANVMLTIVNIIPDPALTGTAVLASAAPFYHIALKYRKDSSSLPELNSAYIYYKEATPGAHKLGYMLHENGSGGLAIIYDLISPTSTTTLKGDKIQIIGSADDYVSPINPILVTINNTASSLTFNHASSLVFTGGSVWTWNLPTLNITGTLTCAPADGLLIGSASKFKMNVAFTIGSSLTCTPNIISDSGSGVLNVNNPNFTGAGTNSTSTIFNYTLSSGVTVTPTITSIVGGTAGQIIIIYVQTAKGLKLQSGTNLIMKRGAATTGNNTFFFQGEVVIMQCINGTIWKEISDSVSEFYANRSAVTSIANLTSPGFYSVPNPSGSVPPDAAPLGIPASGSGTLNHLNFYDNELDALSGGSPGPMDMMQQFEWVGTQDASSIPISDKLNPIYTRRKNTSGYTGKWNKLLSQYGGNDSHDTQIMRGSMHLYPTLVDITSGSTRHLQSINGATPTTMPYDLAISGSAFIIPNSALKADDSSSSLYHINVKTTGVPYGLSNFLTVIFPIYPSALEWGRVVYINLTYSGSFPHYMYFGNIVYDGGGGFVTQNIINQIGHEGNAFLVPTDSTKSWLMKFVCVPTSASVIGYTSPGFKWVLFWCTYSDQNNRIVPSAPIW